MKLFTYCIMLMGLVPITSIQAERYILDAIPGGAFGDQLRTYWSKVETTREKKVDLTNKALDQYPPHVSLTGFFPKTLSEEKYIHALQEAFEEQEHKAKTVHIEKLLQGNSTTKEKDLDYIKLSSDFFEDVTKAFMKKAKIDSKKYFKDPSTFTYHITLRQYFNENNIRSQLKAIHALQDKINLKAHAEWSLVLFSDENFPPLAQKIVEIPL